MDSQRNNCVSCGVEKWAYEVCTCRIDLERLGKITECHAAEKMIGPFRCTICGYAHENLMDVNEHVIIEHGNHNLLEFKQKEKPIHEKISTALDSANYIAFYFHSNGDLAYRFGEGMTNEQLSYVNQILNIITVDALKSNITMEPHDKG